jgi:hypothetical protein
MARPQALLEREEQAWAQMWAQVERVSADDRTRDGVVGDWSTQDMVWHCARWADFCGEHLEIMRTGSWTDPFATEPDAYWDRMNQEIADASKSMTWDDVVAGAESGRERARAAIAAFDEVDQVTETWFAEETFIHYGEHAEHIAAFAAGLSG